MNNRDPFEPILVALRAPASPKPLSVRSGWNSWQPPVGEDPFTANEVNPDLQRSLLPRHDPANAERLIQHFGDDLVYVDDNGWMIYDGVRWVGGPVGKAGAFNMAAKICDLIVSEAEKLREAIKENASTGTQEDVDKLLAWGAHSGKVPRIKAMLECAQNRLRKDISEFDRDPWIVPCLNGTLVLGEKTLFRENRREDYCTKSVAVNYVPTAVCPEFDKFFSRIMPAKDMSEFVMRSLGYSLTGSVREHKLFIWHGRGRNGKSTLMESVRHIFGTYGATTPVEMLLRGRENKTGGEASPEIARLPGVRLVVADEPPENAKLNEGKVKKLTGGDRFPARKLYADLFEFKPNFKIVLLTNYPPHVHGVDEGIWRRLLLIPFNVQIPIEEVDLDLGEKLKEEASGILNRIVAGAEDYFKQGLAPPLAAIEASKDYRNSEDPIGMFIEAKLERFPDDYLDPRENRPWETSVGDLREVYEQWCKEEGREPMSATAFGTKLGAHGVKRRPSNGHTYYQIWIKGRPTGCED